MTTQRTSVFASLTIAACMLLLLSASPAAAQGGYDQRYLCDTVRRVKDQSKEFEKTVDRTLDRSRYDGSNREDRINDVAKNFREAAERLKDRFDDGRNLNRSAGEARALLATGARIDQFVSRGRVDPRLASHWSSIRRDLDVIANAYNYSSGDFDGDRRHRNDDDYRDRRGGGYGRRGSNTPWGSSRWPRGW